jgi:hypothetical protein
LLNIGLLLPFGHDLLKGLDRAFDGVQIGERLPLLLAKRSQSFFELCFGHQSTAIKSGIR